MARTYRRSDPIEPSPSGADGERPRRSRTRRVAAGTGRVALVGLVAILIVLVALVVVIQTEFGRGRVQSIAVAQLEGLLSETAELEVDRLEGNFITGARMLGVRIREGGQPAIGFDTLFVRYRLTTLVGRTFSASTVSVSGLHVYARESADGSWNLSRILRPVEDEREPEPFAWTISLGEVSLRRGLAEVSFHHPDRDSVLLATPIVLDASDFRFDDEGLRVHVDTLTTTVVPAVEDPVPVIVALGGAVEPERVDVRRLMLLSARTDLRTSGSADWSGEALVLNADLRATPLALADVRQFAPVPLYGTADLSVAARGTPEQLDAELEAAFRDNGTIALAGSFTPRTEGPVAYRADGTVTTFDLGRFLGNPALAGTLSGTLAADVSGRALEAVSGPVAVSLRGSEIADQRIERAELDGRFIAGTLHFTLGAAVPGAALDAGGTVAPFAEPLRYDVSGTASNVDLAVLADADGRIRRARFSVAGQGTEPERLVASARVTLSDAQFGGVGIAEARASASIANGFLRFDAGAGFGAGGGAAQAVGTARLFREPLVYEVTSGSVSNLNLAALTGDPAQDSDVSGRFALSGVGTDPETLALDLSATLEPSRFQDVTLAAATLTGTLRTGTLRFDADADLGAAGGIAAVGTVRPFDEPLPIEASGALRGVNLAALPGEPGPDSNLSGTFVVNLVGTDPATLGGTVQLGLGPSRVGAQPITSAAVAATLRAGTIDTTFDLQLPEGFLAATATLTPFAEPPVVVVQSGRFAGLDLATLLDDPTLSSNLNGRIEQARIVGFDPATMEAEARLAFEPSTLNAAQLDQGLVTFALRPEGLTADAELDFVEGFVALALEGDLFAEEPTYTVAADFLQFDALALLSDQRGQSRLNLALDARGTGFDPATMRLDARLLGGPSRLPEAALDTLAATVSLRDGLLDVEEVLVLAPFADLAGRGQVALFDTLAATDFHLTAHLREAGPLNAFLAEPLILEPSDLEAHVTGPAGGPIAFDARLLARQLTYGQLGATRLDARLDGVYDRFAADPLAARARVRFDFVSLPTFNVRDGDVTAVLVDEQIAAEGRVTVDERRDLAFNFALEAVDPLDVGFTQAVRLDRLDLRLDEDRWELLQPARIALGDGRVRVRNLLLFSDDQQLAADGLIDFEGEQTLVATAENVRIGGLTDLIGLTGLDGRLTFDVSLLGPAAAPLVTGRVGVANITSDGEPVGALAAALDFTDERLAIEALLTHVEGQRLTIEGFLPFAFRLDALEAELPEDAPVDLRLEAEAFPIAWAEPFLPPDIVRELDGTLTANVTVGGIQTAPQLDGQVVLADGRLALDATGDVLFRNIVVAMQLAGNTATITQARAEDGRNGVLQASGSITLPELSVGELDLQVTLQQFRAINTPTFRNLTLTATPAQRLRFSGTLTEPVLTGDVTLASGDIFLTDELVGPDLVPVELTEAQIQRLEATFGTRVAAADTTQSVFFDNLTLDLGVSIERNVWLRSRQNPRLDIEFAGAVDVEKQPLGEILLFGAIDVTRGRVELPTLAGRAFTIGTIEDTYGQLIFNGPFEETVVDLRAGFEARSTLGTTSPAIVFLGFAGRLAEAPELTLSADPPMETADIACVVATGRPCGEAFQGGVEDIALTQLGAIVQGVAANNLGLDVVEVTQRPTGEIAITFGTYVTNRTFAAVSQAVTEPRVPRTGGGDPRTPEVVVEYEALRWMLVRLERRNEGGFGGALLFQFEY